MGKDPGWSGGRGAEGTAGLHWGLLRKEGVSLGLAAVNNVGGLWATGVFPHPGPLPPLSGDFQGQRH